MIFNNNVMNVNKSVIDKNSCKKSEKDTKYKDLNEREYVCKSCNSVIDRDLNASINIMFEGLKLYIKDNFA